MTAFTRPHTTGFAFTASKAAFGRLFRAMVNAVIRHLRNRSDVRRLMALDEHMLSDIGLTRGDLRAAIRTSGRIPPLTRLTLLAVERRATARALAAERLGRNRRKPDHSKAPVDA